MTTEFGTRSGSPESTSNDARIDRDLGALGARSRRDALSLDDLAPAPARGMEERRMTRRFRFGTLPRLAAAAGAVAVAAALLLIPVSYQRTVGQRVTLDLSGPDLTPAVAGQVAREFKSALGVEAVRLQAEAGDAGTVFTLAADVPAGTGVSAGGVAAAFAGTLTGKGYTVSTDLEPLKRKVSGSVYAMVRDNVIRVEADGKTDAELESEIAARLSEAGVPNAQVTVNRESPDRMEVQVQAESQGEPGTGPAVEPEIQITTGGEVPDEQSRVAVGVRRLRDEAGEHLSLDVTAGDRSASVTVDDPASMTDAELAAALHDGLAARGLGDLSVSVQDGRVSVLDPASPGVAPAGEPGTVGETSSWGALKKKYAGDN